MSRLVSVTTAIALFAGASATLIGEPEQRSVTAYVRYIHNNHPGVATYGILDGDTIRELKGDLFANPAPTGRMVKRAEVQLLAPCEPAKVIAVGLNYKSHLGDRKPAPYPGLFAKYPSSIVGHDANIVIPSDSTNIHYEGELVVVMGKRAKSISKADAPAHIFGVTAGNDVSERAWQSADLQWFRAKASDTFGPMGPAIVTGLNYNDLLLQTRLNGEVVQSERTRDLLFDVDTIVSYVSKYVTLDPGDVIFTGTPDVTRPFKEGDVIEVEIEGIGVLRNRAIREGAKK
jgi:2-keto-4-pentenoate hydratase/2-oxohepta-3-ene-1,7-dioic acid hydratase in catechol pathway